MHCYGNKTEITPAPFLSFSHYVANYSDYELARGKYGNVALLVYFQNVQNRVKLFK